MRKGPGARGQEPKSELLGRLWVRLLVAGWVVAVVVIYYRLQLGHRHFIFLAMGEDCYFG